MFRSRVFIAPFVFLSLCAQAQCVNRVELLALADSAFLQPYPKQITPLSNILANWNRCQYLKDSSYVNLMLGLAKARYRGGDVSMAIENIEQTLRLYSQPHAYLKLEDQVKAYYRLGFYWQELDEFKKAIEASEKAIKVGEQLPASQWVAFAYVTMAYAHSSFGEFQRAVENAERGMYQAKQISDTIAYLENSGEKIKALLALNLDKAVEKELADAIAIARKSTATSRNLSFFLVYKARIEKKRLNRKSALVYYKEALQINISNNEIDKVIENYNDIGYLYYEAKEYDNALKNYHTALAMASDPYLKLLLLGNIGEVYWKKKQYINAFKYYQMALSTVVPEFSKRPITNLPDAKLIRTVSQKEFVLSLIQDVADTWVDYAKMTKNRQQFQYALSTYRVADQMIDFMRWEHTGHLSKLYWRGKTRGMYERAIETCFRLNNTEQAFRFFEKSRAAMLADKINEIGARQQLTPQQATEEQRLQRNVINQQANLATITTGKSVNERTHRAAQFALTTAQDKLDKFRKQLESSNPTYFRYKYDTTITSLSELRHHLKKQKASFVTYFVGDTTLYVLGVTSDTAMVYRKSLRSYQKNTQAFMRLLSSPDSMKYKPKQDRFLTLGNGLYNQLLAPLNLPTGRVVVSPDGSFVPFETLCRQVSASAYLVYDYAFSYTYSARFLLKQWNENREKTGQYKFLGIAPVSFAPALHQVTLSRSDESLERIAGYFDSPELLTRGAATRRAFLKEAADASVIQLFTHATADSSGVEPQLYFADSTLKLSDLNDGAMPNAQLVVLAACKTGIGAVQKGEGVFSLARGFAALGVPSVLTTLWSVQNLATYELTELFYKYIDEGHPKDIALQLAKQEWLKIADQSNQSPNIWAGLIVVGDTEPLERTNYALWMTAVALVTLISLGGWVWRKKPIRRNLQTTT